jgi:hypothetical protein
MILIQDHDYILAQYAKTFADDEEVDPLRQTYWFGCYSPDAAPVIENLPPPPFGLIVETPASGDLHQLRYDTFKDLIRAGLTDFLSYGPRSEELHDVYDWAYVELHYLGDTQEPEDDELLLTWWQASLPEAIEAHELMGERRTSSCVVLTLCL